MLWDMSYPSYSQINRNMECLGNNISPTPFQNFNIFPKGERIKEEMKRANKNLKKKN
jgi:hypothetical protein